MGGLFEYIKMAVQNIRANKGRSFLTMLGIIIGIASVIAIVSIGEGTKNQMNSEIDGIGSGLIAIDVSNDAMTEDEWITPDDVQEIRKLDTVGGVSVSNNYDGETVTGKGNFSIMLTGEGPDAKMINNSDMKYGSYFGETEIEEGKNVCVISDTDARQLFGTDDVVGMSLDITCYDSSKSFRIMGVTTQKENGTFVSYTYDGMPVTVIAQEKGHNTKENLEHNFGMPSPDGYRKALRLMKQAEKFNRPVICFVDTPGAFCGLEAEERGQGEAIARNLFEMSSLRTPILSIVIGEGGSGGALALAVADEVWMMENAVYSILSPEGYASILWKDSKRAKEAAGAMKMTAKDLKEMGIIKKVFFEPEKYTTDTLPKITEKMDKEIVKFLAEKTKITKEQLVDERYNFFSNGY